jgi:hypothetical protein
VPQRAKSTGREQKLAAALKENLRRRKAQARARDGGVPQGESAAGNEAGAVAPAPPPGHDAAGKGD